MEDNTLDIVQTFKPHIDFKMLAIKFAIDWYLACGKIPYYGHHLFDYLIANKIIEVSVEDKTRVYLAEKELRLQYLRDNRRMFDQYGDTCFVYQVELIEENKSDKVIGDSKIKLLIEYLSKNKIDFAEILKTIKI